MTDPITRAQLENAALDADSLGLFVNSPAAPGTYTTRTGRVGKTLARIQAEAESAGGNLSQVKLPARVYCIGDSITEVGSSTAVGNYPAKLQTKLNARDDGPYLVINKGRSGEPANWIKNRLANDVLLAGDASYAIILAGVNDLRWGTDTFTEQDIKDALQSIYTNCKAAGATVVACTIMPFKNYSDGDFSWTTDKQTMLESINTWIAGTATDVDVVVDTYAAFNDLAHPGQLLPQYDDGSHLHITGSEGADGDGTDHLAQTIFDGVDWAGRTASTDIRISGQAVVNQDVSTTGWPQFWGLTVDNCGYNDTGTYYPTFNISNVSHNVSVGTATAFRPFVVSDRGQEGLEIGPGNANSADPQNTVTQLYYNRLLDSYVTASYLAADYAWKIGTTTKAVLAGTGFLGVGTTAPTYRFVVSNDGKLGWEIDPAASSTQINWLIYDRDAGEYGTLALSAATFRFNPDGLTTGAITLTSAGIVPVTTNDASLGDGTHTFKDLFVQNSPTVGSGMDLKDDIRALSENEIAAAIDCLPLTRIYRLKAAKQAKGDDARLHVGVIYEEVEAVFKAHGVDPSRWAIFCEDPVTEMVKKTRKVSKVKKKTVTVPEETWVVENGAAVRKIVERTTEVEETADFPKLDEDGKPIYSVADVPVLANGKPVLEPAVDHAGKPILHPVTGKQLMRPKVEQVTRPEMLRVPVMEECEEEYSEPAPVMENGKQKVRRSIRYGELERFVAAGVNARLSQIIKGAA